MGSTGEMTRKDFLVLTFTLIGSAAAVGACDDDNDNDNFPTGTAGRGGGSAGRGGTTGGAGNGAGGNTGTAGGGGTTTSAACADPLPEMQSPSDHLHSVMVPASTLNATSAQTFPTSTTLSHAHMVTLQPSDLATLKGGGSVSAMSTAASVPGQGPHTHTYMISCH